MLEQKIEMQEKDNLIDALNKKINSFSKNQESVSFILYLNYCLNLDLVAV